VHRAGMLSPLQEQSLAPTQGERLHVTKLTRGHAPKVTRQHVQGDDKDVRTAGDGIHRQKEVSGVTIDRQYL
jgi:hypothetical protein